MRQNSYLKKFNCMFANKGINLGELGKFYDFEGNLLRDHSSYSRK